MWFRRRKIPAALRPPLGRDERVVAWADTVDGGVVVVTPAGLWLPAATERIGWHQVHKATWTAPRLAVVPAELVSAGAGYLVMADLPGTLVELGTPGQVPAEVHTRVTRSVAATAHHDLPGGGGVRVVARRVPGVDGVTWHVRYDPGTDPDDPEVIAATAELVALVY